MCAVHMYYKTFSRYHIRYCLGFPKTFEKFFKFSTANSMDPVPIFYCLKGWSDIEQIVIVKIHPLVIIYSRLSYILVSVYRRPTYPIVPITFNNYELFLIKIILHRSYDNSNIRFKDEHQNILHLASAFISLTFFIQF